MTSYSCATRFSSFFIQRKVANVAFERSVQLTKLTKTRSALYTKQTLGLRWFSRMYSRSAGDLTTN